MSYGEKSILDVEGERGKTCPKCSGDLWYWKPPETRKKAYNGKRYKAAGAWVCLLCKRARWKDYYRRNRARVLQKNRAWYKQNPEKHKLYAVRSRRKRTSPERSPT